MTLKILLIVSLIITIHCTAQTPDPFAQLQVYCQYFKVDHLIKTQISLSHNITFNSTREKYFFIYFPLLQTCLQKIGEDFQPLLDSVTPSGIGAAGYGVMAGMKVALKVGLWKTGIFGLIKASTATFFSVSVLPVAIGVGALAYIYNKNQQDKIKQKCSSLIDLFQAIVNNEQLQFLKQIKATVYQDLLSLQFSLNQINEKQRKIKSILKKYQDGLSYLYPKIQMQRKYFTSLKQIMSH